MHERPRVRSTDWAPRARLLTRSAGQRSRVSAGTHPGGSAARRETGPGRRAAPPRPPRRDPGAGPRTRGYLIDPLFRRSPLRSGPLRHPTHRLLPGRPEHPKALPVRASVVVIVANVAEGTLKVTSSLILPVRSKRKAYRPSGRKVSGADRSASGFTVMAITVVPGAPRNR